MNKHPDVLIIGGGVIGLTTAYFLARDGVSVAVLDKGDLGREASWAGAGIVPTGNPAAARTPYDQLRATSSALFPALSQELRERTGIDNGFLRCGGLEFASEPDEAAEKEWRGEGVVFERIDERELQRMEPAVALGLGQAYYLPEMAQLRNPRHLRALIVGCQNFGVQFHTGCPLFHWRRERDQIGAVHTGAGEMSAGQYLVAAGAWSDSLLQPFGWRTPIYPVRGQIALLQTATPLFRRVLLSGPRYLVPRPDGRVLAGSTEENAGFSKNNTAQAIAELLELASQLVPALADAHLERCWAGLRPGSPDGMPILGRMPGMSNMFIASGHYRAGILLSPGTALVMTELLLGHKPSVALDPFSLSRFSSNS